MAIPRLNEKPRSNGKHLNAERGYTVLAEVISHVDITNILHLYEDFLDRIVYSCIDFYPQPLNHMILIGVWFDYAKDYSFKLNVQKYGMTGFDCILQVFIKFAIT